MNKFLTLFYPFVFMALFGFFVTGCGDREGLKFGYKGADLGSKEKMFFKVGTVTNYLPARVLMTSESEYEFGERENAFINTLGVVMPSAVFDKLPEGYKEREQEPWFTTYVKEAKRFGFDGKVGFVAHKDLDKNVYMVGESFFSVYVKSLEEALNACDQLRLGIEREGKPLKIYKFDGSWVAEYLRIVAICVVGCRPDGSWAAMLTVRDKLLDPNLVWVPEEEQKELLADYVYSKEITLWQEAHKKASEANHKLVLEKAKAADISFFQDTTWLYNDRELRHTTEKVDVIAATIADTNAYKQVAENLKSDVAKRFGVAFAQEDLKLEQLEGGVYVCRSEAESDLFNLYFAAEFNVLDDKGERISRYYVYALEKKLAEIKFPAKPERVVK